MIYSDWLVLIPIIDIWDCAAKENSNLIEKLCKKIHKNFYREKIDLSTKKIISHENEVYSTSDPGHDMLQRL